MHKSMHMHISVHDYTSYSPQVTQLPGMLWEKEGHFLLLKQLLEPKRLQTTG